MIEDRGCYASPSQRELIKEVARSPLFQGFFLTGGTCLAVFYLHHRVSHDLDFFFVGDRDLTELVSAARTLLRPEAVVASAPHFFSCVVRGVKVDFVADPLSGGGPRPSIRLDQVAVSVDRLDNLGPNKIAALVSRSAPKDAVDCFVLYGRSPDRFLADYRVAQEREALLDDRMYAGEKLQLLAEEAPRILRRMAPDLRVRLEAAEMAEFYRRLGETLFRLDIPPAPEERAHP
jgi:hypothetical protein